jgi:hypothetical protein
MTPLDQIYDPETLALLSGAFDDAWREVQAALVLERARANAMRTLMATRLMVAVRDGERDRGRLKMIALRAAITG